VNTQPSRLLSIGEFSAATQLSPKALRTVRRASTTPPRHIDAGNGYRYYAAIKCRAVGSFAPGANRPVADGHRQFDRARRGQRRRHVYIGLAKEQSYRHAREQRALQSAFVMLRARENSNHPEITERARTAATVRLFNLRRVVKTSSSDFDRH